MDNYCASYANYYFTKLLTEAVTLQAVMNIDDCLDTYTTNV